MLGRVSLSRLWPQGERMIRPNVPTAGGRGRTAALYQFAWSYSNPGVKIASGPPDDSGQMEPAIPSLARHPRCPVIGAIPFCCSSILTQVVADILDATECGKQLTPGAAVLGLGACGMRRATPDAAGRDAAERTRGRFGRATSLGTSALLGTVEKSLRMLSLRGSKQCHTLGHARHAARANAARTSRV